MKKKLKDYTQFKLTNKQILLEARNRCMKEMYAKAQPSANYDDILKYYKECEKQGIEAERVYDRYYLSYEEFHYILEKYIEAYHLKRQFKDNCDIIIRDMKDGCSKDLYIPEHIDKRGNYHPGYRASERIKPLAKIIGSKDAGKVIKFIRERKDFYMFDRAEEEFSMMVSMGDSPCSNERTVKEYWKSKGIDLEIDPRHYTKDDFWCEDNGYLNEEEN